MKYIVILILLLFSTPAKAGLHIGTSLAVLGSDDITPSYNIGYSKFFSNNWVLDFTTNALYPTESKFNKRDFLVKIKTTYIAFSVGKKNVFNIDSLILSGFGTLVKVDNRIDYGNINIDNYDDKAVVFGGNLNYFITDRIAASIFVLLPNTNIDLKLISGLGINYYF